MLFPCRKRDAAERKEGASRGKRRKKAGQNGYEAAGRIRACGHPQAKSIPIIAMTANVFAEDVLAARNAGMDAHIAKPIDLTKLYQALKEKMDAVD